MTAPEDPCSPQHIRELVGPHPTADRREAVSKARILEAVDELPRPADESAGPLHLTASAVVVGERGTVLHRHRRLGRWLQPGGHIDPGESPDQAARRETREETGLAAEHPPGGPRLLHVDVHAAALGHTHLDLRYLLVAPDVEPHPLPGESPHAAWFAWDEAAALADDSLATAIELARAAWELEGGDLAAPVSPPAGGNGSAR